MLIWTFSTRSYIYGNLYKNRVNISSGSGQSDASITIGQLTMADNGTYECSVSLMADLDGTSKSRVRLLVLGECPCLLPGWQEAGGAGGVPGGAPQRQDKARGSGATPGLRRPPPLVLSRAGEGTMCPFRAEGYSAFPRGADGSPGQRGGPLAWPLRVSRAGSAHALSRVLPGWPSSSHARLTEKKGDVLALLSRCSPAPDFGARGQRRLSQ